MFSLNAQAGDIYSFYLDVPDTGDFDLLIYDKDYDSATGRPSVANYSVQAGLGEDEQINLAIDETGIYYGVIRAVEGYGEFILSSTENCAPLISNPSPVNQKLNTLNPTLEVDVADSDQDTMDVCFYNASDDSLIEQVEDVTNSTVSIIWSDCEMDRIYQWYVIVNDSISTSRSPTWSFTLTDDPEWMEEPKDQEIFYGTPFTYQIEATDTTGIVDYTVNNTVHFSINASGWLNNITALEIGSYGLNISASDKLDNSIFATITIRVLEKDSGTSSLSTTSDQASISNIFSTPFISWIPISMALLALLFLNKRKIC